MQTLIPIRDNCWESYHSGANPRRGVATLGRELTETLECWIKLPSWDMFDRQGRRATFVTDWGEPWLTQQSCLYLRQDLLDKYLKIKRLDLVWAVWGEREIRYSRDGVHTSNDTEDVPRYKIYQQVFSYKNGITLAGRKSEGSRGSPYHSYFPGASEPTRKGKKGRAAVSRHQKRKKP